MMPFTTRINPAFAKIYAKYIHKIYAEDIHKIYAKYMPTFAKYIQICQGNDIDPTSGEAPLHIAARLGQVVPFGGGVDLVMSG